MEDFGKGFMEHAQEFSDFFADLRRRLLLCALVFIAGFVIGSLCSHVFIRFIVDALSLEGVQYVVTSPFQLLAMSVDMGLFLAVATVFPLILVEVYVFTRPALSRGERGTILRYVCLSLILFLIGFAYGIAVMYYATWAVSLFDGGLGLANYWDIGTFFSQMLLTSVLLGVLFQFPLLVSAAIRFGVLTREFFASKRRLVIALVLIVVAVLPPTDGLSLLIMALPLVGLYELTLLLALVGRRSVHTARMSPVLG